MAGLNDIYEKLGQIQASQTAIAQDVSEIKIKVASHESLKNRLIGMCAVISVVVGFFFDYLKSKIMGHI